MQSLQTVRTKTLYSTLALVVLATFTAATLGAEPKDENAKAVNAIEPIANADFEKGQVDERPVGWAAPTVHGYRVTISDEQPKAGKQCAIIQRETKPEPRQFGNVMQSIDATPFRGKRVRFRAAVRAEVAGEGNQAQLWFRVDRVSEEGTRSTGAFDNMHDRPIKSNEWKHYEIVGDVAEDARIIIVGLLLLGQGKAWIDDASFEVVDENVEITARQRSWTAGDGIGPGLFEVIGSMRLTPNEWFLGKHRAEYESGERWKDISMVVLIPLPLAYRDQVPLSYEISVNPRKEEDRIHIYEDKPHNYVVKLVLADVLNREPIDVKFRSAVIVAPSSFDGVPDDGTLPDKWPEEAAPWLAATWCADAEHERIKGIVKEIRDDTNEIMQIISRVEQRAKTIFRAADGHVSNLTAVEALDKRGSCTSCANLVAALLRASGVPARVLAGYPSWTGALQTHYIVEAYVPKYGWYPIESTRCQSPWANSRQVNVAIIPTEYEEQDRAQRRCWAAGGVPYLSLTEMPGNPGHVAFRGTIEEGRNCDHQCKFVRKLEAQPAEWKKAIQWSNARWRQWLAADHKLADDGKLSFSRTADQISAKSPAELMTEFQKE